MVSSLISPGGLVLSAWCLPAAFLTFLAGPGRHFPFETLVAASYPLEQAEQAFAHAHTMPGVRVAVVP
ncbi:MAG: hypothetical protein ACRELF_10975 [Gemmataceae bacterium]